MILKATSKQDPWIYSHVQPWMLILEAGALNEPSNSGSGHAMQIPYSTEFTTPQTADHAMWSDMDLGEFMMDNDLDLLGRMFNFSHAHDAGM